MILERNIFFSWNNDNDLFGTYIIECIREKNKILKLFFYKLKLIPRVMIRFIIITSLRISLFSLHTIFLLNKLCKSLPI